MEFSAQNLFFEKIRQKIPVSISLADEIADLLEISNDSAYRRLRGTTALSLDEAITLSLHFKVGLESLSPIKSEAIQFFRSTFREKEEDFLTYLDKTNKQWQEFVNMPNKQGIYAVRDLPVYYFFQFPELGAFKIFFWMKTLRDNKSMKLDKFDFNVIPDDYYKKARMVAEKYFRIPFNEIWNAETVNSTINLINYYHDAGWLKSKSVKKILFEKLEELIRLVQSQAETGCKWFDGKKVQPEVPYGLYYNESLPVDNTMYITTDQYQISLVNYNILDYLYTFHAGFGKEIKKYFDIQISKSQQLTHSSERERNKYFNSIYDKINLYK